jgi:flagella basal body P-ring formation protein FlgA
LHVADLAKADLVHRNQSVTLIYRTSGLCLTTRGKALDNGAEGDVVTVMNLLSKRSLSGTVSGRGQVSITPVLPRQPQTSDTTSSIAAPVAVATISPSVAPKTE